MNARVGITFRLTLVFVLFAAISLAGGGLFAYFSGRQQMLENIAAELRVVSAEKQAALEEWIKHLRLDVEAKARDPELVANVQELLAAAPGSQEAVGAHDRAVADLRARIGDGQPFLRWLVLDPLDGRVVADSDGLEEGKYRENRPYFINGKIGPFVQNVYYSASLQAPAMTIGSPLTTADGRLVGVLAARLDLSEMNAIIQRRTGDRQTDDAFLVNTSHLFVTQPRLNSDPAVLSRGVHTVAVQQCLSGGTGVVLADDYRGVPAIVNFAWLPARDMCLIVKVNEAEAFAPVEAFGRLILLASGIALLVAATIAVALARSITRPVIALQEGTARFGRGELDVRLPETGGDELGALAHAFNQMAVVLSREQTQLRRRLERMYTLSSDLICIADFEGRFQEVNPAFESLLGYTRDELLAVPYVEYVHPDDRAATQTAVSSLAGGRGVGAFENRYRCKDGSWKWLQWNASSDLGEHVIFAVAHDVTERKRAEKELKVLSSRNAAILAAVPDIIAEVDENKVYTWVNRAGAEFFGEGVIGKEAAFYFEGEQDTYTLVQPLFDGSEEAFYTESSQRRQDGEKRLLGWWSRVLKDAEGNVIGALSTARDITERKRAEIALVRANRVYTLISQVNQMIVRTTDADELLRDVCRIAVEFGGFRMAWIGMIAEGGEEVQPVAWAGFEDGYLAAIKPISVLDRPEGAGPRARRSARGKRSAAWISPPTRAWRHGGRRRCAAATGPGSRYRSGCGAMWWERSACTPRRPSSLTKTKAACSRRWSPTSPLPWRRSTRRESRPRRSRRWWRRTPGCEASSTPTSSAWLSPGPRARCWRPTTTTCARSATRGRSSNRGSSTGVPSPRRNGYRPTSMPSRSCASGG